MRFIFLIFIAGLAQVVFSQEEAPSDTCMLSFNSIYNFDVGDVFQYKRIRTDGSSGSVEDFTIIDKYQIKQKDIINDSLIYTVEGIRFSYFSDQHGYSYWHQSSFLNKTHIYEDSTMHFLNLCNDTVLVTAHQEYYVTIFEQSDDSIIQKHIGGYGNLFILDIDSILTPMEFESYEEIYQQGCGLIKHFDYFFEHRYKEILEGYIKGNDTTGIITPDEELLISVNTIIEDQVITIYPNPISGRSVIEWSQSFQPVRLNVYDLMGRTIYSKAINESESSYIDRSDLEKGVLVMEIIDNKGKRFKQQIIVL